MLAYEELKGSSGREIWYRPQRYDARRLFPHMPPRLRVRANTYRIQNISLGGVAAIARQAGDDPIEVGEIVPLTIQQSGLPIFESDARVCWMENSVFASKVAFHFVDRCVDLDKLLNRNAQAQIVTHASVVDPFSTNNVSAEYRAFCADTLRLLRGYRNVLQSNSEAAREFAHGLDQASAFEACEANLVRQWRSLWRTGNDLVREFANDRETKAATKEYTELVLTPEMRHGAIWDRSYEKPLGYPGDFEIMNQVYDWHRVGANAFDMLVHRVGLEVAECIKTRMEVVRDRICDVVREKGTEQPAKILSLGSGPAREVELFLGTSTGKNFHSEFTLIDQEIAALSYAYENTYPHVLRSNGRARVQCMNMSFTDILRGTSGMNELPGQDMIYSVGLLDYLTDRRAANLTHRLYDQLAPGGLLIIGNMNETPLSNYWPMEFLADWTLQYRNEEQMLAWAPRSAAKAWTETEPTGRVRLLFLRKP